MLRLVGDSQYQLGKARLGIFRFDGFIAASLGISYHAIRMIFVGYLRSAMSKGTEPA